MSTKAPTSEHLEQVKVTRLWVKRAQTKALTKNTQDVIYLEVGEVNLRLNQEYIEGLNKHTNDDYLKQRKITPNSFLMDRFLIRNEFRLSIYMEENKIRILLSTVITVAQPLQRLDEFSNSAEANCILLCTLRQVWQWLTNVTNGKSLAKLVQRSQIL